MVKHFEAAANSLYNRFRPEKVLEIGSNKPIFMNNSYILENSYGWKGIMVEFQNTWINDYKNTKKHYKRQKK